jgi:outer membrane protein assembly factor BamB
MMGRTGMNNWRRAPLAGALIAATLLSGCGIFKGGDKGPKTAVLGERIPVLTVESSAGTDASIASNAVLVPPADTNAAWAQPGGNAQKAMGNVSLGVQPQRSWDANLGKAGASERLAAAPVVAEGHLFAIDAQARVHAFDAQTGRELWATQLKTREGPKLKKAGVMGVFGAKETKRYGRSLFGGGVSYDSGKLYATSGLGAVAQIDAATGKLGWQVTPGGPLRGSPSIANGSIYVMSADNQIYALAETDGSTQWTASGPLETAGVFGTGAPAIARATVVAGFSSGDLNAYRYENGRVVWQDALTRTSMSTSVGDVTDVDASPVADESRVYAVGAGGRMIALDLTTGQRLWEVNIGGISTPALGGDWLFVVADDAKLYCVERTTGKIRWTTQLQQWKNEKKKTKLIFWNGPVIAGGRLVLTNSLGELAYVSVADGKLQDSERVAKAPFTLAPVVANNMMYLLSSDGRLTAWR